jgi:hypothetical protein
MSITIDQNELKEILKTAVAEGLEENRDLLREIIEDALEEIALARAIEEGLATAPVSAEEVFAVLEGTQ